MGTSACGVFRAQPCDFFEDSRSRPNHIVEDFSVKFPVYEPLHDGVKVHMLICSMNYSLTATPLTAIIDGNNMRELAIACQVEDLTMLTDEQAPLTKDQVESVIRDMGIACGGEDFFVFYFSGHGTQLKHAHGHSGEIASEKDDAYCFQNLRGKVNSSSCMTDDEFSTILSASIPEETRTIILSDCCHSDTIADLSRNVWYGREVVSISGCMDNETAGDTGHGGIFTHSMLLSIDKLQQAAVHEYSVQELYNTTLRQKQLRFPLATQQFSIEHSSGNMRVDGMCWPLVPQRPYSSPLNRAANDLENMCKQGGSDEIDPELQERFESEHGVSVHVANTVLDVHKAGELPANFAAEVSGFRRIA